MIFNYKDKSRVHFIMYENVYESIMASISANPFADVIVCQDVINRQPSVYNWHWDGSKHHLAV